jgi:hypothetical protein
MPDCKKYGGITRGELNSLRAELAKMDVKIPTGDDVQVKGPMGIELRATYNEPGRTLEICIVKKPFYIPESQIWNIIDSGASQYGKS